MMKILVLLFCSCFTFAEWQFVVIDTGVYKADPYCTVSFAVDSAKKIHFAYQKDGLIKTNGISIDDSILKYARCNLLTLQMEVHLTVDGQEGIAGPDAGLAPSLALDKNQRVHIVHGSPDRSALMYTYSVDGSSFAVHYKINQNDVSAWLSALCVDKDNVLHLLSCWSDKIDGKIYLNYFKNSSTSQFQLIDRICLDGMNLTSLSMDIDSNGKIHFTYSISSAVYYGTYETKLTTTVVDVGEYPIIDPIIGVDKNNKIHICYISTTTVRINLPTYQQTYEYPAILHITKTSDGWQKETVAVGQARLSDKIAVGSNNDLHIVVRGIQLTTDINNAPYPHVQKYTGLICLHKLTPSATYWAADVVDDDITSDFVSPRIIIDSENNIHVCYFKRTTGDLIYSRKPSTGNQQDSKESTVEPAKIHFSAPSAVRKKITELKRKLQQ